MTSFRILVSYANKFDSSLSWHHFDFSFSCRQIRFLVVMTTFLNYRFYSDKFDSSLSLYHFWFFVFMLINSISFATTRFLDVFNAWSVITDIFLPKSRFTVWSLNPIHGQYFSQISHSGRTLHPMHVNPDHPKGMGLGWGMGGGEWFSEVIS